MRIKEEARRSELEQKKKDLIVVNSSFEEHLKQLDELKKVKDDIR